MLTATRILFIIVIAFTLSFTEGWSQDDLSEPIELSEEVSTEAVEHVEDITGTVQILKEEDFRPRGEELQITLEEAMDIAMQKNPDLRMAEHGLESSLADVEQTESGYRNQYDVQASVDETFRRRSGGSFRVDPDRGLISDNFTTNENNTRIQVGPRYTRQFRDGSFFEVNPSFEFEHDSDAAFDRSQSNPSGNNYEDRYNINFSYNYPLNSRPREETRTEIENSRISAIQSDMSLHMREQQITDQVISSYWNIKRLELESDIQNERLLQARRIEFINKVKLENEQIAELDYGQAQVDVLNNEANLIGIEGDLRSSVERFNVILGLPLTTRLELEDDLEMKPLPMSSSEYIQKVTETNLELETLRLSIRRLKNSLRVARMGQQPSLTWTNFYDRSDEGDQNIGTGLVFNWNFGDGGATKARVRALEENLKQSEIDLWNTERSLVQETYNDLRGLQLELQRIDILEKNVEMAARVLDNALFTYTNYGEISFRQMQDFQIDLATNRSRLVQAMVSYNVSKSNLLARVHEYVPDERIQPYLNEVKDPPKKPIYFNWPRD